MTKEESKRRLDSVKNVFLTFSAELSTSDLPTGSMSRGAFGEITAELSSLPEADLAWISALIDVALLRKSNFRRQNRSGDAFEPDEYGGHAKPKNK
jgi:hypothetical protein